jgi:hypothetical protein
VWCGVCEKKNKKKVCGVKKKIKKHKQNKKQKNRTKTKKQKTTHRTGLLQKKVFGTRCPQKLVQQ